MELAYNPEQAPDRETWLALDEGQRLALVKAFHDAAGIQLPSVTAHSVFQSVVETQIAQGLVPAVEAMRRLRAKGWSRHEALHHVAAVLAGDLTARMNDKHVDKARADLRYATKLARIAR